jgi:hypothetical protein
MDNGLRLLFRGFTFREALIYNLIAIIYIYLFFVLPGPAVDRGLEFTLIAVAFAHVLASGTFVWGKKLYRWLRRRSDSPIP